MNRRQFIQICAAANCCCLVSGCRCLIPGAAHADDTGTKAMPLAACGLDCNRCGLFRKECGGCHGPDGKVWSPQCTMRSCCHKTRKLTHCGECEAFPCEHVIAFENDKYPHHRKAIARLRTMRKDKEGPNQPSEGAR